MNPISHYLLAGLFLCHQALASPDQATPPDNTNGKPAPAVKPQWNDGFEKADFKIGTRKALLVMPKSPAPGKPWIWRTEFLGHQPQGDIGLLEKGFHVAYDKNPVDNPAPIVDFAWRAVGRWKSDPPAVYRGFPTASPIDHELKGPHHTPVHRHPPCLQPPARRRATRRGSHDDTLV